MSWAMMPGPGVKKYASASLPTPTIVGSTLNYSASGATNITLPAGSAAGNLAVIAVSRLNTCTLTPPTGAVDLLADYNFYSTANIAHVYGYTLTATDISNGYVAFSTSNTSNYYALVVVAGANATPDVTGSAATASPNNTQPINCPANAVTTTATNDLVLAFGFVGLVAVTSATWTTPSGWTSVAQSSLNYLYQMGVYSLAQSSPGSTGSASIGVASSVNIRGAGIQIAFQPA